MTYHFKNGDIDPYAAPKAKVDALRWKHLSYIMQGSMSLLNPGAADSQDVRGLRVPTDGAAQPTSSGTGSKRTSSGSNSLPTCCPPIRTSCRAGCASG